MNELDDLVDQVMVEYLGPEQEYAHTTHVRALMRPMFAWAVTNIHQDIRLKAFLGALSAVWARLVLDAPAIEQSTANYHYQQANKATEMSPEEVEEAARFVRQRELMEQALGQADNMNSEAAHFAAEAMRHNRSTNADQELLRPAGPSSGSADPVTDRAKELLARLHGRRGE